mmetsp:Transcript_24732/g.58851  ORF Transcript_24732/g.58851 Transcript_24732/m.58851 type:complete len:244 (+) Transcript_24732:65-796(+)
MEMDITRSLGPCIQAVLQVLVVVVLGFVLSWRGFLPPDFVKSLGGLSFDILLPALLFTSVLKTMTLEKLVSFWIYPVWVAMVTIGGYALATAASLAAQVDKQERLLVALSSSFPNSGYLPLLLLPALCRLHPVFADDPGAEERSIGYISVYVCFLSIVLWVVATWALRPAPEAADRAGDGGGAAAESGGGGGGPRQQQRGRQAVEELGAVVKQNADRQRGCQGEHPERAPAVDGGCGRAASAA